MKALIAAGASVKAEDNAGCTALMGAAGDGNPKCVATLIAAGANVNLKCRTWYSRTALMFAASQSSSVETIQILIRAGARVNARDTTGRTALDLTHNPDVKKTLISAGGKS